jgi:cell division protein FtsQ
MMAKPRKGATRHVATEEKQVHAWHRLPRVLFALFLIGALVWGGFWLMNPATLPVKTVRIENKVQHLSKETIRQAVLPYVQGGFLRIDVDAIRKQLEALAWVDKASVRRSWPDALLVQIEEQHPVARWSTGGLLNQHGEVFEVKGQVDWKNLPLFRGPKKSQQLLMQEYQAMQELLTPLELRISHVTLDQRRAWSLALDNGMQLRLGRNNSQERLMRFVRVYTKVLKPRRDEIDTVDLRYTNGFAVRWRDGHATA